MRLLFNCETFFKWMYYFDLKNKKHALLLPEIKSIQGKERFIFKIKIVLLQFHNERHIIYFSVGTSLIYYC